MFIIYLLCANSETETREQIANVRIYVSNVGKIGKILYSIPNKS